MHGHQLGALAEAQARFPAVPVAFCETQPLAQEWTCRWLGACLAELTATADTRDLETTFGAGDPLSAPPVDPAAVRAWSRENGLTVSDRGRVPAAVLNAYTTRDDPVMYLASRSGATRAPFPLSHHRDGTTPTAVRRSTPGLVGCLA